MRNKTGICIFFIILCISFFSLNTTAISVNAKPVEGYIDVTVTEAYNLIENTTNLYILDVRTEDEYEAGHINNSILIPHDEISSNQDKLPQNKSLPLVVYCRSGRRSTIASNALIELNYSKVYNIKGGFTEWMEAKYPFESSNTDLSTELLIILVIASSISFVLIILIAITTRVILAKIRLNESKNIKQ